MSISEEQREQRRKLKGKGKKAYLQYFWDYYKIPALVIVCAVLAAIYIVHSIVTNKTQAFNLMVLNGTSGAGDAYDGLEGDLTQLFDLDTEKYTVGLDLQEYLTPGASTSTYDIGTNEKIAAETAANMIDVMSADEYNFYHFALNGMYGDLSDFLTDEQLKAHQDDFYYVDMKDVDAYQKALDSDTEDTIAPSSDEVIAKEAVDQFQKPDPSTMEQPVAVGIIINDTPLNERYHLYDGTVGILGIVSNTNNPDLCREFVDYLYSAQ